MTYITACSRCGCRVRKSGIAVCPNCNKRLPGKRRISIFGLFRPHLVNTMRLILPVLILLIHKNTENYTIKPFLVQIFYQIFLTMGKQANPERIRQFQQDAELLIKNGWNPTMIAERMDDDASNIGAYINYRPAIEDREQIGRKPGEKKIQEFYNHFSLEVGRLKHDPTYPTRESETEFNQDERQRRIQELEASKKYLEEQMAAIIQNNTTLTNTNAGLGSNIGDLSRAYVELAKQAQGPPPPIEKARRETDGEK